MQAYILDAVRTPIGRYGGQLSAMRADDLAAQPLRALITRNPDLDWRRIDDVILGDANQAGESNRNVARMAALLAGLPLEVPGTTLNRLCGSGMDAVGMAARGIKAGEYRMAIAGGVESMSRAPFVMPKAESALSRKAEIFDTTIGWRFINPAFRETFGTHSMPETAENVAREHGISRDDQDAFAARSQARYQNALQAGHFSDEIVPVEIAGHHGASALFGEDEHPRINADFEKLSRLKPLHGPGSTVTAGNASGINDGAAALLMGGETDAFQPLGRIVAMAACGVEPRVMGIGPVPAVRKVLGLAGLTLEQMDVIELNEAFAAQALAVLRALEIADDAPHVNPNGGAIALGHPLGMSGARLVMTAAYHLRRIGGRYGLCTMCVGVGQGIAMIIERA